MRPVAPEALIERIGTLSELDPVARPLQRAVRSAVPDGSTVKDLLSGTWLGHPLHPLLTDAAIGSWASAVMLDVLGGPDLAPAAQRLIGLGVLSALPTAASGLSDWADVSGSIRRIGLVHATGNTAAVLCFAASWAARRRGRRGLGIALGLLGSGVMAGSAWVGGHLAFRKGVGVDQTAFVTLPSRWTAVAADADLHEGRPLGVRAGDVPIVLLRDGGAIHALADRCSHRGCSLSDGEVRDGALVCPCHGSAFRPDGAVAHGPATAPQPRLDVRVEEGAVQVRRTRRI